MSKLIAVKKVFSWNENKNAVNIIFTGSVLKARLFCLEDEDWFVGALDSVELNTTDALISVGINKNNILLLEVDRKVTESHVAAGVPVHLGDDFGDDAHDETYSQPGQAYRKYKCLGFYFDTCGHVTKQKTSVLSAMEKLCLIPGSVLGFTFCRSRISCENFAEDKKQFLKEVDDLLRDKALKRGNLELDLMYSGQKLLVTSREAHMNSFIYTLAQEEEVVPEKVVQVEENKKRKKPTLKGYVPADEVPKKRTMCEEFSSLVEESRNDVNKQRSCRK
jgi:hypothetical protein